MIANSIFMAIFEQIINVPMKAPVQDSQRICLIQRIRTSTHPAQGSLNNLVSSFLRSRRSYYNYQSLDRSRIEIKMKGTGVPLHAEKRAYE